MSGSRVLARVARLGCAPRATGVASFIELEQAQGVNAVKGLRRRNQQREVSRRAMPVARERNPTAPRVPIRHFARSDRAPTLAVFRQERAGICASMLTRTWERTRTLFFVLFKSNLPLEGVLLLIMSYWTYDGG